MSDVLSFAEIDVTHVELLPARTVLSMFRVSVGGNAGNGGQGGKGGVGGEGEGKAYFLYPYFYTEGDVTNSLTGGAGGADSADGGAATGGAATVGLLLLLLLLHRLPSQRTHQRSGRRWEREFSGEGGQVATLPGLLFSVSPGSGNMR